MKIACNLSLGGISESVNITVIWPNKFRHVVILFHLNDHVSKQFDKIIYLSDGKKCDCLEMQPHHAIIVDYQLSLCCSASASKESEP